MHLQARLPRLCRLQQRRCGCSARPAAAARRFRPRPAHLQLSAAAVAAWGALLQAAQAPGAQSFPRLHQRQQRQQGWDSESTCPPQPPTRPPSPSQRLRPDPLPPWLQRLRFPRRSSSPSSGSPTLCQRLARWQGRAWRPLRCCPSRASWRTWCARGRGSERRSSGLCGLWHRLTAPTLERRDGAVPSCRLQ